MTFSRSVLPGRLTNILVPCMNLVGLARNSSRFASPQVTFASLMAVEKLNPEAAALLLPTTLASDGPFLLMPGSVA